MHHEIDATVRFTWLNLLIWVVAFIAGPSSRGHASSNEAAVPPIICELNLKRETTSAENSPLGAIGNLAILRSQRVS